MNSSYCAPGRFFQLGYVCIDLDAAIAAMTAAGTSQFLVIDVAEQMGVPDAPVRRIALAYLADLMIEIIEVDPTIDSVFVSALPEAEPLCLHHMGYLVEDEASWDRLQTASLQAGYDLTSGAIPGAMRYCYVDRRHDVGHFLEYVQLEEGGRALFGAVPKRYLV